MSRRSGRACFTLIEVLLAIAILAIVMALSYEILNANLAASDRIEKMTHRVEIGPAILHSMEQDIRCAFLMQGTPVASFVGVHGPAGPGDDQVDFLCTRNFFDSQLNAMCDYSSVGYRMDSNDGSDPSAPSGFYTLYRRARRVTPMVDQNLLKQGTLVTVYTRVKTLTLRYFDGQNWQETWDSKQANAFPKAVEVTLVIGYDDGDDKNTDMTNFMTDIPLPQ